MRLTVPEPKITLYHDGFDGHDQLSRKETGAKLSDLVERIDDPMVIALDGAWGSGKSFFLKCWVGEHLKREDNSTQTVYFDAFQHDFLDDPLIALTAAISERVEREPDSRSAKTWKIAKNAAPFLGKAALRLGTAALVGKAISLTGDEDGALNDIGPKLAEEGGDISKSLSDFWKKEDGKRAAMEAFRRALSEMTEPDGDGSPTRKLVIVVDELDRCRPDYALSLLEIIKHFFNVDGVHFVLGVNLKELQNSVRARYGNEIEAAKYLQKFTSLILPLTGSKVPLGSKGTYSKYFEQVAATSGFDADRRFAWMQSYLLMVDHHVLIGLRDIERLISQIAVTPDPQEDSEGHNHIYAGLSVLRVIRPEFIQKARLNQLDYSSVRQVFRLGGQVRQGSFFHDAGQVWSACTLGPSGGVQSTPQKDTLERLGLPKDRHTLPADIIAHCFDAFKLPDGM